MANNCRFAFAIHVLSVLAYRDEQTGEAMTSDELAHTVNTNAVVIRRLLGDLRAAGLVTTQRGAGGGVRLALPSSAINLAAIRRAVEGELMPFGAHPNKPAQCCVVGRGIQTVLDEVSKRAADAMEKEYRSVSLADVVGRICKSGNCLPSL
ncbi:MAG TPA: Rrf2 family transcriptional regulator [Abditibacteriaceae bacterium]|jgi:Rrf2 family protein